MRIETGQVAVVTAGNSGIGFAIADALAGQRGHAAGVRADVSSETDLDALADETVERFGGVDLVCNNAGVVCEQRPTTRPCMQSSG